MNNRELIKQAAKATKFTIFLWRWDGVAMARNMETGKEFPWNPLSNDADNRRLQIKLGLGLIPVNENKWACIKKVKDQNITLATDINPNYAVVLAAVEISKQKGSENE